MDRKTFQKLIDHCKQAELNYLSQFLQLEFPKLEKVQSWLTYHLRLIKEQRITYGELISISKHYRDEINAINGETDELAVLANEMNNKALLKLNFSFRDKGSYHSAVANLNSINQEAFFKRRVLEAKAVEDLMKTHADVVELLIPQNQTQKSRKNLNSASSVPEEADNKESSNADKLSIAESWMDPLMKDITAFEFPTHDQIFDVFKKRYPGFELEFKLKDLKTPKFARGGKHLKTSIAMAIMFIYKRKHPGQIIKEYTTITKKYEDWDW